MEERRSATRLRWRTGMLCLLMAMLSPTARANAAAVESLDREVWSKGALLCGIELPKDDIAPVYNACPPGTTCFPGEGRESPTTAAQCGDGDMTVFNSLLCLADISAGCQAVQDAQNIVTGQWYRSPRLRTFPRLRTSNTFSPDMALGVLLWAALNPQLGKTRLQYWVDWLGRVQRCAGDGCSVRIPRFCPDDDIDGDVGAEYGCTFRPGDAATLSFVAKKLGISVKDPNLKTWMRKWGDQSIDLLVSSAIANKPGYSQHLVAINILVHWKFGATDPRLDQAAKLLFEKQPKNAFFAWLAGQSADTVNTLTLARCPSKVGDLPAEAQRRDWTWQREDESDAWTRMMVWDCRFMAGLSRSSIKPKGKISK